ncbi:DUF2017 family protein [Leucobacter muris]|uniref:DUF2017 family protein n=1 Tax=Leucobacter muris TaxID=1935379 RepID=A0ABX5QEW4_9MICO|nr:DUF2017 family protein [Leucobacter muris]QAB17616.1 DUF2017 family protein [Leucobacter muris]
MRLLPLQEGGLRLLLEHDEAAMLDQLVTQLIHLLQSHSSTALDPDPLFASLEVGGSDEAPDDPALARLFPDAYEDDDDAGAFRRVTEQGLLNRKLQDAMQLTSALGLGGMPHEERTVEVDIPAAELPAWARTLTALRLAIAARIGLDTAGDHASLLDEDETRGTVMVFDWLAAILESVLAIMAADPGDAEHDDTDDDPF